jgi:hypothetical protein
MTARSTYNKVTIQNHRLAGKQIRHACMQEAVSLLIKGTLNRVTAHI